ncbi:MAG: hypothetical protein H7175_22440 [Burkholderiales bacterium]|nr:hypothetical protein [Anaerolineae bacterium]
MSTIANFRVKYPRPKKLSDPFRDFSGDTLAKLLATPDDELSNVQYRLLFGPHLPAGTYEEIVYFVPGAFRYLLEKADSYEFTYSLIGFVSQNAERLKEDGILEIVRDCIRECLAHWTEKFIIADPNTGLYYTAHIGDFIDQLVKFRTHVDLAETFVRDLAYNETDPVKAAWFLEYARWQGSDFYPSPEETINQLIDDKERLENAAAIVRRHSEFIGTAPLFWRETFELLNVD